MKLFTALAALTLIAAPVQAGALEDLANLAAWNAAEGRIEAACRLSIIAAKQANDLENQRAERNIWKKVVEYCGSV
jgi:hypothetical protein